MGPATGEAAGHRKGGQPPGERSARFAPRPQRRVTTTSRYSLGTTSEPLPPEKGQELERDLTELLEGLNQGGSGSLVVPSEYLEIVVTRR